MATLNDFVSKIRTGDLARSNRFEVEILSPGAIDSKDVNILCEDASVPGLIIPYAPVKIGNITEPRAHGMEFFGDNATFTFFCDTNWDVRSYFENWMAAMRVSISIAYKKWVALGAADVNPGNTLESAVGDPSTNNIPPKGPITDDVRSFSNLSIEQYA